MAHATVEIRRTLTQVDFDRFARLSGDNNPIHVDPAFSASTRFGRTVAHGMLLHSIFRGLLNRLLPGATQIVQNLKFPAPTFAGDAMCFSVQIESQDGETVSAGMSCRRVNDGVVTCEGDATLTLPEARG